MSKKPIKKSDAGKDWMKKRGEKLIRICPQYHLIVTEGEKTEPLYFEAIKEIINRQYRDRIHLEVKGTGLNTIGLFEKAYQMANESANPYRHIWIVYDTDDFPRDKMDRTVARCKKYSTDNTTYHAIWSNQCIELWFLLHFCYLDSDVHRKGYFPKLNEHLQSMGKGEYSKGRADMYDILSPYIDTAIQNAKRREEYRKEKLKKSKDLPSKYPPSTKVYELLEVLKPYLQETTGKE